MRNPSNSAEGSSIFSQLRTVKLYGSSKPSSTRLKPTNERPECQRCWQDRRTLHNGLYPHRGQADRVSLERPGVERPDYPSLSWFLSAAPKGGSCGGKSWQGSVVREMAASDRYLYILQSHRNCPSNSRDHPAREKVRCKLKEPLKRVLALQPNVSDYFRRALRKGLRRNESGSTQLKRRCSDVERVIDY
jgi:hypothetical protein